MSRIVQVANFVAPASGGLKTVLRHLGDGYAAAGHEVVQIVPGAGGAACQGVESACSTDGSGVRQVVLPGRAVPGTGYRLLAPSLVRDALDALAPDRLEVHDRTTLRGLGDWAARRGVRSLVVSHERLDRLAGQWLPVTPSRAVDRSNAALAASYDTVVCTTDWAADEFDDAVVVPLGVDLDAFAPHRADPTWRRDRETLLVVASRLSKEKRVDLALGAADELRRRGDRVRIVVAGDGPLRRSLQRRFPDAHFLGYVDDRTRLAGLLAAADVVVAPGPVETFGLAALEALASGTPVVAHERSALPSVLGPAGVAAAGTAASFATAVETAQVTVPRAAARRRAEQFPWYATILGFLDAHRLAVRRVERVAA